MVCTVALKKEPSGRGGSSPSCLLIFVVDLRVLGAQLSCLANAEGFRRLDLRWAKEWALAFTHLKLNQKNKPVLKDEAHTLELSAEQTPRSSGWRLTGAGVPGLLPSLGSPAGQGPQHHRAEPLLRATQHMGLLSLGEQRILSSVLAPPQSSMLQ